MPMAAGGQAQVFSKAGCSGRLVGDGREDAGPAKYPRKI